MDKIIMMRYGELVLKGQNRFVFEEKLLSNIRSRLRDVGEFEVKRAQSTVYAVPLGEVDFDAAADRLKKIFGISSICIAEKCEKNMDSICELAVKSLKEALFTQKTFKVEARREDKKFPLNSPQINAEVGGYILKHIPELKVDVRNPDIVVNIDIRSDAYIYTGKIRGAGGMPVGTNGKATLLLSGGIDSPVAGYMIAKRGVVINAVHFYSFPYTSERAKEKVIDLARILSEYCGRINLHIVPFTDIQLEINKKCPENYLVIIMRRIMMKIAEITAKNTGSFALVTGESIGQVASQTMESLVVTDNSVDVPVFRPVIGMDKEEIVTVAKKIGTYETSILPYEDCCTVFVPKHPKTKPKIDEALNAEKDLDIDAMIKEAIANTEVIRIGE